MLKKLGKVVARALSNPVATSGRQQPRPRRFGPELDPLQERLVPAYLFHGTLYIDGTNASDVVSVSYQSGYIKVTENGQSEYFSAAGVTGNQVVFYGYDGNDTFTNSTGLVTTAYGMNGNDVLVGGSSADYLYGGEGDDWLYGQNGNDLIYGGAGGDIAYGGSGHDTLLGQDGDDYLFGEAGIDVVYGGNGSDWVEGGADNDLVGGGNGRDWVLGGSGNDTLTGGYLNIDINNGFSVGYVSDGNTDDVCGGSGNDTVYISDKKLPWWWLDSMRDQGAGDDVNYRGWGGFESPPLVLRWGHLYGT